jgi:EAL domain-containing protein (putative c-di-GMP-specific phosphodiesterase class I)
MVTSMPLTASTAVPGEGAALSPAANVPAAAPVTQPLAGERVERVMELARRHLKMDVAFISEIADGRQNYRAVQGAADAFGLVVGGADPAESTYCNLMIRGDLPHIVPDSGADGRTSSLGMTGTAGIGSYAGVPLRYSDGELYGTFCCLGSSADPMLTDRDGDFMAMLAELLVEDLDALRERANLVSRLTEVIENEELTVAVQPIVDLTTGRCVGFEALSRFAEGSPDVVFAQADAVGLGVQLERLAVQAALRLLPQLTPDQYLSVNLTPIAAAELAAAAFTMEDLPLHQLVLEITEHKSVSDYTFLRERLDPLRGRGLRVAIDDAGAGFASLHHVVELQPDIIKIDRSLVDGVATNRAQRSIIAGFVLLALDVNASLVAEGVETREDLDVLADMGVDAVQGFLLARPSSDRADLVRWKSSPDLLSGARGA